MTKQITIPTPILVLIPILAATATATTTATATACFLFKRGMIAVVVGVLADVVEDIVASGTGTLFIIVSFDGLLASLNYSLKVRLQIQLKYLDSKMVNI